jgi:Transglycosylase SLT domain
MRCWPGCAVAFVLLAHPVDVAAAPARHSTLDRVASAVDGAESGHGEDLAMWRPDPSAPQGPMQVTAAAATDVGGGDRFVPADNRAIGRAYLELLYRRYHNWPDAIAAYNWGIGKLNAWLAAGRPASRVANGVAAYTDRVLRDSGLCAATDGPKPRRREAVARIANGRRSGGRSTGDRLGSADCGEFANGPRDRIELAAAKWRKDNRLLVGLLPEGFFQQLGGVMNQTELDLRAAARQ